MSTGDERAAIIANSIARLTSNYCATAGSVLVVYEYIITFARETQLFWRGRLTGAAVLFYFNRYMNLLNNIYGLMQNLPISEKVRAAVHCPPIAISGKIFGIMQYVPWAIFSGLRAFALTRNIVLSTLIFLLSCVPVGVNYAHFHFNFTGVTNPITGCLVTDDVTTELRKKFTIASRTCLVAADILLVYVTWFNMYRRVVVEHPTVKNRFMTVLLRDGTIYFVVLALLNTLHLTLALLSIEYSTGNVTFVTQFSEPLTTILVSRFLLHLQAVNRRVIHLGVPDSTGAMSTSRQSDTDEYGNGHTDIDTVVFQRVLGSLAESLDHTTYGYDRDAFEFDFDEEPEGEEEEGRKDRAQEKGKVALVVKMRDVEDGVGRGESMEMSPVTASTPHSAVGRSAA